MSALVDALDFFPLDVASGPAFLVGYIVTFVVCWFGADLVRGRLYDAPTPTRFVAGYFPLPAELLALSYLSGGAVRATHALLALARVEGVVCEQPGGVTQLGRGLPLTPECEELQRRLVSRSTGSYGATLSSSDVLGATAQLVREREGVYRAWLVEAGLRPGAAASRRILAAVRVPLGLLVVVGALRLARGVALDHPVKLLVLVLGFVVAATVFAKPPTTTPAGRSYLSWLERSTHAIRADVAAGRNNRPLDVAISAALGGLGAVPFLALLVPGAGGGAGGASCGSSCGGGGCGGCGGGCGG